MPIEERKKLKKVKNSLLNSQTKHYIYFIRYLLIFPKNSDKEKEKVHWNKDIPNIYT